MINTTRFSLAVAAICLLPGYSIAASSSTPSDRGPALVSLPEPGLLQSDDILDAARDNLEMKVKNDRRKRQLLKQEAERSKRVTERLSIRRLVDDEYQTAKEGAKTERNSSVEAPYPSAPRIDASTVREAINNLESGKLTATEIEQDDLLITLLCGDYGVETGQLSSVKSSLCLEEAQAR